MDDDGIALQTPWLLPLSKGHRRSTIACRLQTAALVTRNGVAFIQATIAVTRKTLRYTAASRVQVKAAGCQFTGTIERTSVGDGVRNIVIRVAS